MSTKGVVIAAGVIIVVVAGTIAGGELVKQGPKKRPRTTGTTRTVTPSPAPSGACSIRVEGTIAFELSQGTTSISELYELKVLAFKRGTDLAGTYRANGAKGTFTGKGKQSTLNTKEEYEGKVVGGGLKLDVGLKEYDVYTGTGTLVIKAKIVDGTATGQYGTKPIARTTTIVKIPVKVTVEGPNLTVKALSPGTGSLVGGWVTLEE